MKRREFLNKGLNFSLLGLALNALPNLAFAKENLNLWGAPALISLPLIIASKARSLNEFFDVKFQIWKSPDQLRAGFASKDFKLSAAPFNAGIAMANKGLDIKLLNILTLGLNYIFTKDESVNSLQDLRGKSILIPFKNDLPDIIFQALCKRQGLASSDFKIHYAANPIQAAQLFVAKDEFDAVLSQEPMASAMSLMAKKNAVQIYRKIDIQALWQSLFKEAPKIYQAGLIVDSQFYEANKDFFNALNLELSNALEWIKSNESSAAEIGARYLPAPQPAIKEAISRANLVSIKASQIADELEKFSRIIYELNPQLLGGKMPSKDLFL